MAQGPNCATRREGQGSLQSAGNQAVCLVSWPLVKTTTPRLTDFVRRLRDRAVHGNVVTNVLHAFPRPRTHNPPPPKRPSICARAPGTPPRTAQTLRAALAMRNDGRGGGTAAMKQDRVSRRSFVRRAQVKGSRSVLDDAGIPASRIRSEPERAVSVALRQSK